MNQSKISSDKKIFLIKEEVKNLENSNLSKLSGLESELLKYSREFEGGIEVISIEARDELTDDIKKVL